MHKIYIYIHIYIKLYMYINYITNPWIRWLKQVSSIGYKSPKSRDQVSQLTPPVTETSRLSKKTGEPEEKAL